MDAERSRQIMALVDEWRGFWTQADQEEKEYAERVDAVREMEDLVMTMPEDELLALE